MNSQTAANGWGSLPLDPIAPDSHTRLSLTHTPDLMKTHLFALLGALLLLPLAACADNTDVDTVDPVVVDDPVVTDDGMMDDGMMDDDADMAGDVAADVDLAGTIDAAGNDITALAPASALANINGWINTLDGQTFTNATEIRDGLMTLKDQLSTEPLNGAAIGETLTNLGTWTKDSAPDNAEIQTLGDALLAGGTKLTGM